MKKYLFLLIIGTLAFAACNSKRNIEDLKLHADKVDDVKAKWGQADSIAIAKFMGLSAERWFYKKDSVVLLFKDDLLVEISTPESEARKLLQWKIEMEEQSKAKMDSLYNAASKELEENK